MSKLMPTPFIDLFLDNLNGHNVNALEKTYHFLQHVNNNGEDHYIERIDSLNLVRHYINAETEIDRFEKEGDRALKKNIHQFLEKLNNGNNQLREELKEIFPQATLQACTFIINNVLEYTKSQMPPEEGHNLNEKEKKRKHTAKNSNYPEMSDGHPNKKQPSQNEASEADSNQKESINKKFRVTSKEGGKACIITYADSSIPARDVLENIVKYVALYTHGANTALKNNLNLERKPNIHLDKKENINALTFVKIKDDKNVDISEYYAGLTFELVKYTISKINSNKNVLQKIHSKEKLYAGDLGTNCTSGFKKRCSENGINNPMDIYSESRNLASELLAPQPYLDESYAEHATSKKPQSSVTNCI